MKERLENDPRLHDNYSAFIKELVNKGYAGKVPPDQKNDKSLDAWYVPHHGIYNPHKPGKIRVVFDSSAKFRGVSLNSMLCKGPNLTNSLVGVLKGSGKTELQ